MPHGAFVSSRRSLWRQRGRLHGWWGDMSGWISSLLWRLRRAKDRGACRDDDEGSGEGSDDIERANRAIWQGFHFRDSCELAVMRSLQRSEGRPCGGDGGAEDACDDLTPIETRRGSGGKGLAPSAAIAAPHAGSQLRRAHDAVSLVTDSLADLMSGK